MRTGLIGRKVGMTQIFKDDGIRQPVTIIEVGPCSVVAKKTSDKDGYDAVQLGYDEAKPSRVTKSLKGHFAKAGTPPMRVLKEFRVSDPEALEIGTQVTVVHFEAGAYIDVTGRTIGKGFAGAMKRWGFKGGRASHGAHRTHRSPGSIGQCQDPGRVFKNKKMSGHMGDAIKTVQNLQIAAVDAERNLLLVMGSVPGAKGGVLFVNDAIKKSNG